MNDVRVMEPDAEDAELFAEEPARPQILEPEERLAALAAELQHRIELLEEDVTILFTAARLAGLRERELLSRLGLCSDALERHNDELMTEIPSPGRERN